MRTRFLLGGLLALTLLMSATSAAAHQVIAFGRLGGRPGIFVFSLHANHVRRLTPRLRGDNDYPHDSLAPDWAPDGSGLAFTANRHYGPARLFTINADGSDLNKLTHYQYQTENGDFFPSWSPTGHRILYQHDREESNQVLTKMPDGRHRVWLVRGYHPAWSPTGDFVTFGRGDYAHRPQIWISRPDGTRRRQLTFTEPSSEAYAYLPEFSPNGNKLVYVHSEVGFGDAPQLGPDGTRDLCVVRTDGAGSHCLTSATGDDVDPEYSRDGTHIVFVSYRRGTGDIYSMRSDGSHVRRLTRGPGQDSEPRWSPNARWIAFLREADRQTDLFVVRTDGSNLRRLTDTRADELAADWKPVGYGSP